MNLIVLCAALALQVPQAPAPEAPKPSAPSFVIDAPAVERATADVLPRVSKAVGIELDGKVTVRIGTREEIRALLEQENVPLMTAQLGDAAAGALQAKKFATTLAPALLAKYAFGRNEILVAPEGFDFVSEFLGLPELVSATALRATLVHELVHAADDQRFGLLAVFSTFTQPEQFDAYSAVLEGHAQLLARRVCAEHGDQDGFDLLNHAISGNSAKTKDPSEPKNPVLEMIDRVLQLRFSTWYVQGEKFMQALETEGGAETIARTFAKPPGRMALIEQPDWFLHPELEPKGVVDLKAVLDDVAAGFPKDEWVTVQSAMTRAQLNAVLELASEEARVRVLRSLGANRSLVIVPKGGDGSRMIAVILLEFSNAVEAAAYVGVARALSQGKDEMMKEGVMKIVRSEREEWKTETRRGFYEHKAVQFAGDEIPADGAIAAEGSLALELVYSNEPRTSAELAPLVDRIFEAAAKRRL